MNKNTRIYHAIRWPHGKQRLTPEEVAVYLDEHGPVWEMDEPVDNRCCLCSCYLPPDKRNLWEWRRTGLGGRGQKWYYCLKCWPFDNGVVEQLPNKYQQYEEEQRVSVLHMGGTAANYEPAISGKWLLPALLGQKK